MNRWAYPVVGLSINIILGTIYSWSVFRNPLERLCGWTDVESCLPFSIFLFFFAVTMPVGGVLTSKIGPRTTAVVGAVMVGLGWMLSGAATELPYSLTLMLVFYGVLAGSGVGLVYGVPISVSSKWFPERRGLAVGLTVLGFGLSPLITAPLAAYMIASIGVSFTMILLGAVFGILLATLSSLLRFPPPDMKLSTTEGARASVYSEMSTVDMVRTRTFKALWLSYMFGTLGGFIAISVSAKYGTEVVGLTPEAAALTTALFALFNGAGRPLFGHLTDRIGVRRTAIITFSTLIIAAAIAMSSTAFIYYVASFALFWLVFGGWLAIAPTATSTFFGMKHLGANYGVVFTAYGASALVGPPIAAYLQSLTQTALPSFAMIAALAIGGLALSVMLGAGQQPRLRMRPA